MVSAKTIAYRSINPITVSGNDGPDRSGQRFLTFIRFHSTNGERVYGYYSRTLRLGGSGAFISGGGITTDGNRVARPVDICTRRRRRRRLSGGSKANDVTRTDNDVTRPPKTRNRIRVPAPPGDVSRSCRRTRRPPRRQRQQHRRAVFEYFFFPAFRPTRGGQHLCSNVTPPSAMSDRSKL